MDLRIDLFLSQSQSQRSSIQVALNLIKALPSGVIVLSQEIPSLCERSNPELLRDVGYRRRYSGQRWRRGVDSRAEILPIAIQ